MTRSQSHRPREQDPEYDVRAGEANDADFLNLEIRVKLPVEKEKEAPRSSHDRRSRRASMAYGSSTATGREGGEYSSRKTGRTRNRRVTMDLGSLRKEHQPLSNNKETNHDSNRRKSSHREPPEIRSSNYHHRTSRRASMDTGITESSRHSSSNRTSSSTSQYPAEIGTSNQHRTSSRRASMNPSSQGRNRRATMDLGSLPEEHQPLSNSDRGVRRATMDLGAVNNLSEPTSSRRYHDRQRRRGPTCASTTDYEKRGNIRDQLSNKDSSSLATLESSLKLLHQQRKEALLKSMVNPISTEHTSLELNPFQYAGQVPKGFGVSCDEQYEQRTLISQTTPNKEEEEQEERPAEENLKEISTVEAEQQDNSISKKTNKKSSKKDKVQCSSDMKYLLKVHAKHTKESNKGGLFKKSAPAR
mmetsp:Transcript_1984/g.3035  ORF Transcript_1984/g.3035 Transcript_1984/m.3035 type:complete len:416 (-) Transcript_1984:39-1286(-)